MDNVTVRLDSALAVLPDIRREAGTQKCLGVSINLRIVAEHLPNRPDRLNDRATGRSKIPTLALNRDHPGHMGIDIDKKSEVESVLCDVECAVA